MFFTGKHIKLNSIVLRVLICTFFASCSTNEFRSKIDNSKDDLLSEESFMRYNSIRLDVAEKKQTHFVTDSLKACHQKKFKKGLGLLEENTEANKKNPEFWNALGTCYLLNNEKGKASFYYNLALEALSANKDLKNSKQIEAVVKNNIGLVLLYNNRINEAYDHFNESNSLAPEFNTPVFNMAQVFMEYHQNDKALKALETLRAKNQKDVDVLYSLSVLYQRINLPKKSYEAISAIDLNYLNRADIVGVYALNLYQNKEFIKAKEILEKRTYADEFNSRNKMLLELVENAIKAEKKN